MAPNIGLRQSMQLRQQLVMTQRLQQALKLLQVPTLELEQILRKELVENPLLEEVDHDEEVEEATQQETEIAALEEGERVKEQDPQDENRDWGDSFDDGFRGVNNERGYDEEDEMERPQKYVPSGQEALSEQLQLAIPEGPERNIGEYIIGCLGADGLLACPLEEIAAFFEVDVEVVEAVLTVVQTFDPPGVAARDISECLLLQLEAKGQGESPEAHIIRQHFESLKNRKFSDIAREMKITPREVQDIAQRIGELDPRPGLSTSGDGARAIVPDLEVIKVDEDGDGFAVALMDGNLPRLRVSQAYESQGQLNTEDDVKFIDEKKKHAEWVIKTIEQRRRTMIKVMEAIVAEQTEFFEKGAIALKPLTLNQVASTIGMHESTVSRVTRQKFVQTPRGVFPLKFFFSAGLDSSGGGEVAAKAVKIMIQEIVSGENPARPLSDKKIVDLLHERGLKIARRTVAKYREQLGILSARMRKQF
jgi:RNA polymerase sigma-54 factor|nr:RNA polymerase factor sigma-54 [Candidatus Krumholzibacteria bacterium]